MLFSPILMKSQMWIRPQKYTYFFSPSPILTASYRILPHCTDFYRIVPIGLP